MCYDKEPADWLNRCTQCWVLAVGRCGVSQIPSYLENSGRLVSLVISMRCLP